MKNYADEIQRVRDTYFGEALKKAVENNEDGHAIIYALLDCAARIVRSDGGHDTELEALQHFDKMIRSFMNLWEESHCDCKDGGTAKAFLTKMNAYSVALADHEVASWRMKPQKKLQKQLYRSAQELFVDRLGQKGTEKELMFLCGHMSEHDFLSDPG